MALKISVVTACFNSGATLRDCIASVARQTYPDIEHVIIDGASKDDTAAIVAAMAIPQTTFVSEPDNGIYDAWNKGIRRANGDYIWLLNSDDQIFDENTIQDAVEFIAENKDPDVVYGKLKVCEKSTGYSYIAGRPASLGGFLYGMQDFCILATIIRKDVFARIGHFNEDYRISSDYDWAIRLFKDRANTDIVFFDRILTLFSVGGVSNLRYRVAYSEVARIVATHYSCGRYLSHRIWSGWRMALMSLLPLARATGVLAIWRRLRTMV